MSSIMSSVCRFLVLLWLKRALNGSTIRQHLCIQTLRNGQRYSGCRKHHFRKMIIERLVPEKHVEACKRKKEKKSLCTPAHAKKKIMKKY